MWTCIAAGGGGCGAWGGSGDIATTVDLPVGASATYTVTGVVDAAATGTLTNTATITAGAGTSDSDGSNNSATDTDGLTPEVDLVIVKDDGATTAVPGTSVTYTITVTNPTGPSDVVGAIVTDTFPAELSGTGWSCAGAHGGSCAAGAGLGDINTTVDLPVGATATFTATGTVISTATVGSLTNAAAVSAPMGVTETDASDNTDSDIDTLTPRCRPVGDEGRRSDDGSARRPDRLHDGRLERRTVDGRRRALSPTRSRPTCSVRHGPVRRQGLPRAREPGRAASTS